LKYTVTWVTNRRLAIQFNIFIINQATEENTTGLFLSAVMQMSHQIYIYVDWKTDGQ